jgi:hypothetical protein
MVGTGGMDPGPRGMVRMHGPEEEIINPAKMTIIAVVRYPGSEKPVQRQGVNQGLEVILVAVHAVAQGLRAVVGETRAEVV